MKASVFTLSALVVWAAVSAIGQAQQDEPKTGEDKSSGVTSGSSTNQIGSSTNSYGSSTNLAPTSTNKLPRIYGTNSPSEGAGKSGGAASTNAEPSDVPK